MKMKKHWILVLLLVTTLLTACGKSHTCYDCGSKARTAYYTMAHDQKYVLCEDCAETYWWPMDYSQYKVGRK